MATISAPAASARTELQRRFAEIVRQKKRNLGLAGHTTTHDFQILAFLQNGIRPRKGAAAGQRDGREAAIPGGWLAAARADARA